MFRTDNAALVTPCQACSSMQGLTNEQELRLHLSVLIEVLLVTVSISDNAFVSILYLHFGAFICKQGIFLLRFGVDYHF